MLVRQMLEIYDLLDTPQASGEAVAALLRERGAQDVTVTVGDLTNHFRACTNTA